ncbi:hypothetical protein CTRI78_v010762 [Colletotrichum trifolii]|uniref:N-acetyltransferase domain-containing protein n=1 Tax=Colletotrichum trifolii TaxID=5466 RepID=A0A4R8QND9_COLTR|nr:hypothetical protein CTRI78_v010762 [Colletotrichum trifolii]
MATSPVVEVARLEEASELAKVFLKCFNDDFFQTLFPHNAVGRTYMTKAYETFMLSKQNGSQEGQVFVVKNDKGSNDAPMKFHVRLRLAPCSGSSVPKTTELGLGASDGLPPLTDRKMGILSLDSFFTDMAIQHEHIMGKEAHVYFELIMTDPAYQRRGYALALLRRASQIADELGYRMYLDAEKDVMPLYNLAGYVADDKVEQTSFMVPMVRPAQR